MSFCVSKDLNLQQNALKFLFDKDSNSDKSRDSEAIGGILSNLNYAWLISGSKFVVIKCKNGSRVGSWDFANTLLDSSAKILRVDEILKPHGKEPLLVLSINSVSYGGIVCVFDFIGSKVIRAIQFEEQISTLHVIHGGLDLFNLSGPLRNFDGIFAVGTVGGNVYIVDICRQLCYEGFGSLQARDELNPCKLQVVTSQNLLDIENHKKNALRNESHLAIHLNVVRDSTTNHFVLKGPNGADKVHVNRQEVLISAIHYCPMLGSLLVGYNFGAYQLWNLMNMELIYTSPICEDHVPITNFAVQEPADDPRAFCFIWAVYSSEDTETSLMPYLVMYAFSYESKEFHEGYGLLYEGFQYCAVRFHMELGFSSNQSFTNSRGGKCLRMESITHKNSSCNSEMLVSDAMEDFMSLCVVIWKANTEDKSLVYMAIFDLNQWYKAQMPKSPNDHDCSSYMITICVSDSVETIEDKILDVAISGKTIQQFTGAQKLEEHYYPSALSFDSHCLMGNKYVSIQYQSVQKALLYQLQSTGPLCLIRPTETYQEIISHGLTPLFVETSSSSPITSLNFQRQVILSVSLEQQFTSWLCKCATEWANGSFTSAGCSLELLISWAFDRATVLKKTCESLCVPLFDYSEVQLDGNTTRILNDCIRQIKNITFFYSFIMRTIPSFSTNTEFIGQYRILQMIEIYFDVLQWLLNVGLLPEYTLSNKYDIVQEEKIRAPYPVEELEDYYRKRRAELQLAHNQHFSSRTSVLFIDNMINIECGGDQLGRDWKDDGGDGFYPPRSLQALLRTYLLDGIEVSNKHSVVIYLFLDLAMILDANKYSSAITHLIKFPAVFEVCPSLIKVTQAFWQLDHGDFSTAMELLLDPLVNQDDLKSWHHKVALKSLLVQEQYNSALLYLNVKKPPIIDDEDVVCALSLFISNSMLDEAFYLEKHYKNYYTPKKLIKHLFAECHKRGYLNSIIYRNLSADEEELFLQYLDEVKHPEAADLKITYFVQRSHYMEAFKTYQQCDDDPVRKGLISQSKLEVRDQIVHSYKKLLPTVSYKFIESCAKEPNPILWREVIKPEPMSVSVKKVVGKTEYKPSIILAALAKAKQTSNGDLCNFTSMMNSSTEDLPFLRTPTRLNSQKRQSIPVIIPKVSKEQDEDGPSPEKRRRLNNSFLSNTMYQSTPEKYNSILVTPIVTRKKGSSVERSVRELISTPTSILKNNSLVSGRKAITRTSSVRFDVPSSSEENSSQLTKSSREREARTSLSNDSISFTNSSKSFSHSSTPRSISNSEDIFFSPNSSLTNIEELPKDNGIKHSDNLPSTKPDRLQDVEENENLMEIDHEDGEEPIVKIYPQKSAVVREARLVKLVDYESSSPSTINQSTDASSEGLLKSRKTYKRLSNVVSSSVRSSPRLTRNLLSTDSIRTSSEENSERSVEDGRKDEDINSTPVMTRTKCRSRKSIRNQSLEKNDSVNVGNIRTSQTSFLRSENKNVSISSGQSSLSTYSKFEISDLTVKTGTSGNSMEEHSVSRSFSSIKETELHLENDSSDSSESASSNNADPNISRTFMEDSVEDSQSHQGGITDHQELRQKLLKGTEKKIRRSSRRSSVERKCTPDRDSHSAPKIIVHEITTEPGTITIANVNQIESPNASSQKISTSSTVGRNLSLVESSNVTPDINKQSIPKRGSKLKPRRSLARQVLESNAIARLTSEYQSTSSEENVTCLSEIGKEHSDLSLELSSVDHCRSTATPDCLLTDSLLEDIAFGQLKSEKNFIHNQNEQSSSPREESKNENDSESSSKKLYFSISDAEEILNDKRIDMDLRKKHETDEITQETIIEAHEKQDRGRDLEGDADRDADQAGDTYNKEIYAQDPLEEKNTDENKGDIEVSHNISLENIQHQEKTRLEPDSTSPSVFEKNIVLDPEEVLSEVGNYSNTSTHHSNRVAAECNIHKDPPEDNTQQKNTDENQEEVEVSQNVNLGIAHCKEHVLMESPSVFEKNIVLDPEEVQCEVDEYRDTDHHPNPVTEEHNIHKENVCKADVRKNEDTEKKTNRKEQIQLDKQKSLEKDVEHINIDKKDDNGKCVQKEDLCSDKVKTTEQDTIIIAANPSRRLTRRSSKLFAENSAAIENLKPETSVEQESTLSQELEQHSSKKNNLTISDDIPSTSGITNLTHSRKRTRSIDITCSDTSGSKLNNTNSSKPDKIRQARRSLRSASAEYFNSVKDTSTQLTNEDFQSKASDELTPECKNRSVTKLDEINVEELTEDYSLSRRLTRGQAKMMESSLRTSFGRKGSERISMDSSDMEVEVGIPDSEETSEKVSPSSSEMSVLVSGARRPARRLSRSSSTNSESSSVYSTLSFPRRTRRSPGHEDSPIQQELSRFRSSSADVEPVSLKKRIRAMKSTKTANSSLSDTSSIRSTRSKKLTSSISSGSSTRLRNTKVIMEPDLPKIKEENTDGSSSNTTIRKSRRKK